MSNTAALLGSLLTCNADINYYTQQQIFWSKRYEANAAKLEEAVNHEEKWYEKYDKCLEGKNDGKDCVTYKGKPYEMTECDAIRYANDVVGELDEAMMEELADLDIEYDTMKCMYETLLEGLRAEQEGLKTATSTAAQDTGLLNAG